jgi:branched-chain amino acid transport system permease protein
MTYVTQQVLNALSLGSLYALLALGLAIVFAVIGLVNFAYGELVTITGVVMLGLSYASASAPLMFAGGIVGAILASIATERVAFRPVRNAPPTTMLLTSFGVSIVVQSLLLQFMEGGRPRAVPTPAWMTTVIEVGSLRIQTLQLLTTGTTALALVLVVVVLRRTTLGIAMRAAAQDFGAVRLMGIRADGVIRLAFAISGLLAGVAGVLYVARRGAVDPYMGFIPVIKAFIAAVLGGFRSLVGAVLGGFLLGGLEVFFQAALPDAVAGMQDAFIFLVVGTVLVMRPQGVFGNVAVAR